jgi:tRNA pseudouridine38-40 synthase
VDIDRLREASVHLLGTHDFAAFGTPPRAGGSTVRTVHTSWWQCDGEDLIYEIVANAFLYHMVRRLVYAQVVVAQGILAEQEVFDRLEGTNRTMLQGIAPPQGLVLAEVIYSDEAAWLSRK